MAWEGSLLLCGLGGELPRRQHAISRRILQDTAMLRSIALSAHEAVLAAGSYGPFPLSPPTHPRPTATPPHRRTAAPPHRRTAATPWVSVASVTGATRETMLCLRLATAAAAAAARPIEH